MTQVPLFLHLLRLASYSGLQDLEEDLNTGFALVGRLHPGPGWQPRAENNRSYVKNKLNKQQVDKHWESMLQELIADRAHGKVTGPYLAPSWWPVASVSPDGSPLLKLPSDDVAAACCFAVVQADKVRRCEDLIFPQLHSECFGCSPSSHH